MAGGDLDVAGDGNEPDQPAAAGRPQFPAPAAAMRPASTAIQGRADDQPPAVPPRPGPGWRRPRVRPGLASAPSWPAVS